MVQLKVVLALVVPSAAVTVTEYGPLAASPRGHGAGDGAGAGVDLEAVGQTVGGVGEGRAAGAVRGADTERNAIAFVVGLVLRRRDA